MQESQYLKWHEGTHYWDVHDNEFGVPYPRHMHSINGVLTIAPNDPTPHFSHGPEFKPVNPPRIKNEDSDYKRRITALSDGQRDALVFIEEHIRKAEAELLEWNDLRRKILDTAKDWG